MGTQYFRNRPEIILQRGPVIPVGIGNPVEITGDQIEMKGELCNALVDTGAHSGMINPSLAKRLNLPVHGFTKFSSASHDDVDAKVYVVSLFFPPPLATVYTVQLSEAPRDFTNHHLIIGRDIISKWHITFDLNQGRYSISTV
ncbi:MAG: retropepsin-like domain-containing protein [Candidatus Marinimicrobia bacterium]|nr:retropepsin-like domain-containing protein [Candidatus Neomarinimicrobiota bacterium]